MSNQMNAVFVGSSNMDMIFHVKDLPAVGQTILSESFYTNFGGKGANQAVACAKLGGNSGKVECAFVGRVGNDLYGEQMTQNMKNLNSIDISQMKKIEQTNSGMAVISVDQNGQNQIILFQGANAMIGKNDIDLALNLFDKSNFIVCQLEIPIYLVTLFNPAPAFSFDILMKEINFNDVTIIVPNEIEAEILTGIKFDLNNIKDVHRSLLSQGPIVSIITLGQLGASLCIDKRKIDKLIKNQQYDEESDQIIIHCQAPQLASVIDTSGAGDCFIGALDIQILQKCVEQSIMCASMSVQRLGTQSSFPSADDIHQC
ncbi:MAG: Ribokinase [Streblomastix strix]|uniref:Ribokinase n=1 Tax=Streblomastix strix TaxID=222440 RepID=A0A5J4W8N5_9EUKA|nr:MAG: Ribokinase [Streblomastix strix]